MKTGSDFRTLDEDTQRVSVHFDGQDLSLRKGGNLAAELLAAGITTFRNTPVSRSPRGPFCMMGACYDCLVEIDGVMRQACMCEVKSNMRVTRPSAGKIDHA